MSKRSLQWAAFAGRWSAIITIEVVFGGLIWCCYHLIVKLILAWMAGMAFEQMRKGDAS